MGQPIVMHVCIITLCKGAVMACVTYEPRSHSLIKNEHSFTYLTIFMKKFPVKLGK